MSERAINIGITVGDPSGIGPEIVFKSLEYFSKLKSYQHIRFHIMCPEDIFRALLLSERVIQLDSIKKKLHIQFYNHPSLNISGAIHPGRISADSGRFSYQAFKELLHFTTRMNPDAVVTGPIDKRALHLAGIPEADHTAMMERFFGTPIDTMFKTRYLRVFFFTKHIPLMELHHHLTRDKLLIFLKRCHAMNALLGYADEPIYVAGINPHASDGGRFGHEEASIITPAVEQANNIGIPAEGPFPADSIYYQVLQRKKGCVVSLYHDQGHIATKMVDFFRTVSFSLGAPVLRVSVDHGTAMDIAGKNLASPLSMIQAIREAIRFGRKYKKKFSHRARETNR